MFYLRYLLEDSKQNLKGWLDLPPTAKAPVYNDKVFVKVLRIPSDVNLTFKNDVYKKTVSEKPKTSAPGNSFNQINLSVPNEVQAKGQSKSPNKVLFSSNNGNSNSTTYQKSNGTQKFNSQGGQNEKINLQSDNNLLNIEKEIRFQESKKIEDPFNVNNINFESINFHEESKDANSFQGNSDLLGSFNIFKSSNESKNKPTINENHKSEYDLGSLGIDFSTINSNTTNQTIKSGNEEKSSNPSQTKDNQNMFDLPPLQVDFSTLDNFLIREICDPIINLWAKGDGFEKKNIRMLLSTLHEIWKHERWVKVSLGDILEDTKLKKIYNKSILQIHPDKIHSPDPRMKYCAERVCNILTDSYSEYKK